MMVAAACGGESPAETGGIADLAIATSSTSHRTDFLTAGCNTHVFPGLPESRRQQCIQNITRRGYTHMYVYAYNEDDYGGPSFDFDGDPAALLDRLAEIREAGLLPVVWLFPDDAPELAQEGSPELLARIERLVPVIDPLVDSYVLGLELDEYWETPLVDHLGSRLRALTSKRIGVHQTPGRWDLAELPWVDHMVLQYGFGLTEEQIREMTARAVRELRKPVVAGEYELQDEARAKALGDAAVSAGAAGFGNGGTAPVAAAEQSTTFP